jgi:hypothetical protein
VRHLTLPDSNVTSAKTKLPQQAIPAQQANEHAGATDSQIRPDKNRSFCPSAAKMNGSSPLSRPKETIIRTAPPIRTKSPVYDKLVSNLQESKARGAMVVAIATEGDEEIRKHADHVIYIPKVRDAFSAITASVPLQLLARAIAVARGCDVDQPRNLAKSVTVE